MVTKIVGKAQHLEQFFPSPREGEFTDTYKSFYSSPENFANFIEGLDEKKAWYDAAWDADRGGWYGTNNMEEALALIRSGWKEGIDMLESMHKRIVAKHPVSIRRKEFGIVGDVPDVPRAVSGNPLNMRKPIPGKGKRKIITLVSDMSANCGHGPEEFLHRAAVVATLVDHVEAAGYSCEVIAMAYSQNKPRMECMTHIILKESNQPTDVSKLAFGLGHPGMFRRLVFADWTYDAFTRGLGYGLGYNHKIDIGSEVQKNLAEKHMYVIPSVNDTHAFKTIESSETKGFVYLMQSLREQKCPCFSYEGIPEKREKEDVPEIPEDDD